MSSLRFLWTLPVLCITALAWAQDVASGPERGKKVPPLTVFDATGSNQSKEFDYPARRKGKPTVYVFVQADKWDRPMARFLCKLDEAVRKVSKDGYVVAVWLTDDPGKAKEYLPVAQRSLQLQVTALTCFSGKKAGPDGWGINADAHLTVAVANRQKVTATFGYRSVNETDVPGVRDALKKAIGGK